MTTPRAVLAVLMVIGSLAAPLSAGAQLGYAEGTNLTVEYRWAAFSQDRLLALARELVRLKVHLIVAAGGAAALAARKATSATPIVFAGGDPVGMGLVSSLARPGGNATGVSLLTYGLGPKRLALLKEVTSFGILSRSAVS